MKCSDSIPLKMLMHQRYNKQKIMQKQQIFSIQIKNAKG